MSYLFGGSTGSTDTWAWDGRYWTQVSRFGPDKRTGHTLTLEPTTGQIILFGGEISPGRALQNTWAFDGEEWTQLEDIGPSPRHQHAAAYDAGRSRLVVFGGGEGTAGILGDTWEWDGTSWTQTEASGPPPRRGHSMAYDSLTRKVVLFGGLIAGGPGGALRPDNHTWEWDGTNWREVADTGPSARSAAATASSGGSIILHGGKSDRALADTWQWAEGSWVKLQEMGPARRQAQGMTYDSLRQRIVLFGGEREPVNPQQPQPDFLGDTWEAHRPADGPGGPAGPTARNLTVQPATVSLAGGGSVTVQFDVDKRNVDYPYIVFMVGNTGAIGIDQSVIRAGMVHEARSVTSARLHAGVGFLGLTPPVSVNIATNLGNAVATLSITS